MNKNKVFTVSTAHLDTVWRWELKKTIEEYLKDTIEKNFNLFDKYPNYKFNFEGAYRYELIEEYYPWYFEKIKVYIAKGNWNICGSCYESGDVNIPSPEAIIRNFLYGNEYFKTKFGKTSCDVFLPDCFGFGWSLPSIAKHCNLKGFTTQKLSWGCAYQRPFDLGVWKGVDSSFIYANLNAQTYRYKISNDVRGDLNIISKLSENANLSGIPWTLNLYGDGDFGGSPDEKSVQNVCNSYDKNNDDYTEVLLSAADDIYKELDKLDDTAKNKLSVWNNELVMTNHGVGAYTSRGMSKRLNSKNEIMADICERACVLANTINDYSYPHNILDKAWKRVIKHQFHDDITGTSTMNVYNDSWNDYFVSLNQFKQEYEGAVNSIAQELDTSWTDECSLIVNNTSGYNRTSCVNAHIKVKHNTPYIKIYDKDNNELPSQIKNKNGKEFDIVFLATVSANAYKVFDVRCSETPCEISTELKATEHSLENAKYKVLFNRNGDIASIFDKKLNLELLASPIKLALFHNFGALDYPSWELRKEDLDKGPYGFANSPKFKIVDNGCCKISIEITRQLGDYSTAKQTISLDAKSEFIKVDNYIDWNERRSLLKVQFPLSCSNNEATYDLGLGFIKRSNNTDNLYEVPCQKWADITDASDKYGISIFSDCKYGWDKPDDNTLRLSCIHTPTGAFTNDARQDIQDIGRNIFSFGIYCHSTNEINATQKNSELFNKPMLCFQTNNKAKGKFNDELSLLSMNNDNVIIRAIKKSQDGKSIILRVNETTGNKQDNVKIKFVNSIKNACEVYGSEEYKKDIAFSNNEIELTLNPFEIKSISVVLNNKQTAKNNCFVPLELDYNTKGITSDESKVNVILQGSGCSLPQELIQKHINIGGVPFVLENDCNKNNLMVMREQEIVLPDESKKLYIVAASTLGDKQITIKADNKERILNIKDMKDFYSLWDMAGLNQTACISNDNVAYEFTHTHHPSGNLANEKVYFYLYTIDVKNCKKIVLPSENSVIIMAMTASIDDGNTYLATYIDDKIDNDYKFKELPALDKIVDKAQLATIKAGNIQKQIKAGQSSGLKNSKIFKNIIKNSFKKKN